MSGSVYFIRAGTGPVKIGWALDPQKRLKELQTGSAEELQLIGTKPGDRSLESKLHAALADERIRGEWFQPSSRVLNEANPYSGYVWRRYEPRASDHEAYVWADAAASFMLRKFHSETDCGKPYHWAECEALCDAFGYASWDDWQLALERLVLESVGEAAA